MQWRLTFPHVDVESLASSGSITSPDLLHVKFELLFCELTGPTSSVSHEDIESLIPKKLTYEVVASQHIIVQKASSELHQYFPITFSNSYCTELDGMLHASVTGIRYDHFKAPVGGSKRVEDTPIAHHSERRAVPEVAVAAPAEEVLDISRKVSAPLLGESDKSDSISWRNDSITYSRSNSRSNSVQVDANGFLRGDITTKHNSIPHAHAHTKGKQPDTEGEVDPGAVNVDLSEEAVVAQVYGPDLQQRRSQGKHMDSPLEIRIGHTSLSTISEVGSSLSKSSPLEDDSPHYNHSAQRRATTLIASKTSGNAAEPVPRKGGALQSILNLVAPNRGNSFTPPGSNSNSPAPGSDAATNKPKGTFLSRLGNKMAGKEHEAEDGPVLAHHTGKHSSPTNVAKPSKILTSTVGNAPAADTDRAFPDSDKSCQFDQSITTEADAMLVLSADQVKAMYEAYSQPVIDNFHLAVRSSEGMLEQYYDQIALDNNNTRTAAALLQSQLFSQCPLVEQKEDILMEMQKTKAPRDIEKLMRRHIDQCNVQLSLRWSVLLVAMRRIMHAIRNQFKEDYLLTMKTFWKQQIMICTRSVDKVEDLLWNQDDSALQALQAHMDSERSHDRLVINGQVEGLPARNLSVFDGDVHMIPSRLPYLFLEQNVHSKSSSPLALYDSLFSRSEADVALLRERPVKHLVVLVHGFLGCEADLWTMAQALKLHVPQSDHLQIFIPKSNEHCQTESFAKMGDNLAEELYSHFDEYIPELLATDEESPMFQLKVSFFAHSMGGLIVRHALQDSRLQPLVDKLQVFVSMACPHLGTLYMSSSIVSAGMWALSTFKQYKSLKELNMDEEAGGGDIASSLIYKLSLPPVGQTDLLAAFKRIVLVSAPEDQYVPAYSANIEVPPSIAMDGKPGHTIAAMAHQLLSRLRADRILRLTLFNLHSNSSSNHIDAYTQTPAVTYTNAGSKMTESIVSNIGGTSKKTSMMDINNAIGRTAHICYLENPQFTKQMAFLLLPYLQEV